MHGSIVEGIDATNPLYALETCVGREDHLDPVGKARADVQTIIGTKLGRSAFECQPEGLVGNW